MAELFVLLLMTDDRRPVFAVGDVTQEMANGYCEVTPKLCAEAD